MAGKVEPLREQVMEAWLPSKINRDDFEPILGRARSVMRDIGPRLLDQARPLGRVKTSTLNNEELIALSDTLNDPNSTVHYISEHGSMRILGWEILEGNSTAVPILIVEQPRKGKIKLWESVPWQDLTRINPEFTIAQRDEFNLLRRLTNGIRTAMYLETHPNPETSILGTEFLESLSDDQRQNERLMDELATFLALLSDVGPRHQIKIQKLIDSLQGFGNFQSNGRTRHQFYDMDHLLTLAELSETNLQRAPYIGLFYDALLEKFETEFLPKPRLSFITDRTWLLEALSEDEGANIVVEKKKLEKFTNFLISAQQVNSSDELLDILNKESSDIHSLYLLFIKWLGESQFGTFVVETSRVLPTKIGINTKVEIWNEGNLAKQVEEFLDNQIDSQSPDSNSQTREILLDALSLIIIRRALNQPYRYDHPTPSRSPDLKQELFNFACIKMKSSYTDKAKRMDSNHIRLGSRRARWMDYLQYYGIAETTAVDLVRAASKSLKDKQQSSNYQLHFIVSTGLLALVLSTIGMRAINTPTFKILLRKVIPEMPEELIDFVQREAFKLEADSRA